MLVASGFYCLRNLFQTRAAAFGGRPGPRFVRRAGGAARCSCTRLSVSSALRHGLGRSPLFHGQRRGDSFAQFMLHMEEVRRVMRPEVMFNIRQQARGLIAGRLDHLTVEPRKGLLHERLPGVVIPCLGRLL